MESLSLVKYPSEILKKNAKTIEKIDYSVENLVEKMFETMIASDGVGLAAPQVGKSLRLFVAAPQGKSGPRYAYLNPEILKGSGTETGPEGCLSFPGVYGEVDRFREITVRYQDLSGKEREEKLRGFLARIFQHEHDHLKGILFIEHLGFEERRSVLETYRTLHHIAL